MSSRPPQAVFTIKWKARSRSLEYADLQIPKKVLTICISWDQASGFRFLRLRDPEVLRMRRNIPGDQRSTEELERETAKTICHHLIPLRLRRKRLLHDRINVD